jgi:hypothetical protein
MCPTNRFYIGAPKFCSIKHYGFNDSVEEASLQRDTLEMYLKALALQGKK